MYLFVNPVVARLKSRACLKVASNFGTQCLKLFDDFERLILDHRGSKSVPQ